MKCICPYGQLEQEHACCETAHHLEEYVAVMKDEPADQLIKFDSIYHDLNRILGNEV